MLSIGTDVTFTANATGSLLARAEFSIARANWTYDFVTGQATQSGFKPEFRPSIEAEGQLSVSAELGLPIGLEFGITVFNGCTKCKGSVGVIEEPSLKAEASIAIEAAAGGEKKASFGLKAVNNCTGISTQISFKNKVAAAAKGFGFAEKEWTIHETDDIPLQGWCIGNKTTDGKAKPPSRRRRSTGALLYARDALPDTSTEASSNATAPANTTTTDPLIDLTDAVLTNLTDIGYAGPDIAPVPYDLADDYLAGYDYTPLVLPSADDAYVLAACSDHNLYIQRNDTSPAAATTPRDPFVQCGTLWQRYEDIVLATPNGAVLHYYNNTMARIGVSRLRVHDQARLPEGSVYV